MERRRLLAICASTSVGAGCSDLSFNPTDSSTDTPETPTPTDTVTDTPSITETRDEDGTKSTKIADQPCPPFDTPRARAVCSHTVNADSAAVYLKPNPEHRPLDNGSPADEISLTFHNQSSKERTFNPNSWRIWHTPGTGWEELQPETTGDGEVTVQPDETHTWSFMEAVESIRSEPELEPGLYGAEIGVPDRETSSEWVACIALVQLNTDE